MAKIGWDNFYCKKAFQFINLEADCGTKKDHLAKVVEFSMWLAYQIHDANTTEPSSEPFSEPKKENECVGEELGFSSPVASYMRYKF